MYVFYPGPAGRVIVPALGESVAPGDPIRVTADIGRRLVAQGWTERITDDHGNAVDIPANPEPGPESEHPEEE